MKRLFESLIVFAVVAFTTSWAVAQSPYDKVVVFGDSLSDTGNAFEFTLGQVPPAEAYFNGRFSNGPIWIDFLQESLGGMEVANFAVGGASTGFGFRAPPDGIFVTGEDLMIPTVGTQIELYLQQDAPSDDDLFIVWAGSNDLFTNRLPFFAALNMELHIRTLAAAGAEEFLVPNLAPLGETPSVSGFESFLLNFFSLRFNRQLDRRLDSLEDELGITIHRLDTFTLTLIGTIFPDLFGFTNTDDAALFDIQAGLISPDEGATYLFWDIIHPTSLTHSIIAAEAVRVLSTE
ncbi:MAG: SGNH/GDSL hydrolase family protein [Planctomycetota bacterium]